MNLLIKISGLARLLVPAFICGGFLAAYPQSLDLNAAGQPEEKSNPAETRQVQVGSQKPSDAKRVRNFIKDGNKKYKEKRYSDAVISYNKALEVEPVNEIAQFNLASSLLQSSGNSDPKDQNSPINQAIQLFNNLTRSAENLQIIEKSFYNLGNISFNKENYGEAIEMYKNVLRRNPANDSARENLRLAQLKKQEQDQNKDNKDQNQDQQQQQQQQNQNQDQKQQQQNQNQDQQQKDQQQQQQQQQMSQSNAERILKALENQEAATRKRVEAQKSKEQYSGQRQPEKPW